MILITGTAGFIGYFLTKRLLEQGKSVVGIDNINDYYDVSLKRTRLKQLEKFDNFTFIKENLANKNALEKIFADYDFEIVVNLAAQAGVRYSIDNPHIYGESNLTGFLNILEGCRQSSNLKHFIYASSSSVYGANTSVPFATSHNVDHPVSLYAATKKSNELMAHSYSHLYRIPTTGLRFFTVYGPWGRPDMAYFSFTQDILQGRPIKIFNNGDMRRDFTYIDDIVEGITRVMTNPAKENPKWSGKNPDPSSSNAPYKIYNIGNNNPVELMHMIEVLEKNLGKSAEKTFLPMQAGDVQTTYADVDDLQKDVGFKPSTSIEDGIKSFIQWYKGFYIKQ